MQQYKIIKTGILHNPDNKIIYFVIKVPIFTEDKYFDLVVEPIPNFNGKQI